MTDNSREVSDFIAGFTAHKSKRMTKDCCEYLSISSENHSNQTYLHELSRGGLTINSQSLRECVAQESSSLIRRSKVLSRKARKHILMRFLDDCNVACAQHQEANIFFNNQIKLKTETVGENCYIMTERKVTYLLNHSFSFITCNTPAVTKESISFHKTSFVCFK